MRKWTGSALVKVMACHLAAPSHYLNECWLTINWTPGNKLQWNPNRNSVISIQENAFEIVICQNGGHFLQGWLWWVNNEIWSITIFIYIWILPFNLLVSLFKQDLFTSFKSRSYAKSLMVPFIQDPIWNLKSHIKASVWLRNACIQFKSKIKTNYQYIISKRVLKKCKVFKELFTTQSQDLSVW